MKRLFQLSLLAILCAGFLSAADVAWWHQPTVMTQPNGAPMYGVNVNCSSTNPKVSSFDVTVYYRSWDGKYLSVQGGVANTDKPTSGQFSVWISPTSITITNITVRALISRGQDSPQAGLIYTSDDVAVQSAPKGGK